MMLQWFINETREAIGSLTKKIDAAVESWVKTQTEAAERITKLEGELKALKARMGKSKQE
jgi:hypothetical protein